jgi:HK97 family phage major capsid protein
MNKTSRELKEARGVVAQRLVALDAQLTSENRAATADEQSRFDADAAEQRRLDVEIEKAEQREAALQRASSLVTSTSDNGALSKKDSKELRNFSFKKAINEFRDGKKLTGLEAEVHQEGVNQMRNSGTNASNGIAIPDFMVKLCSTEERKALDVAESRALSATGGSSGSEGGVAVATQIGDLIPSLKPRLVTRDLGATVLSGLVGNLTLPRNTNVISAAWEGEVTDADEASTAFDGLALTPKRLAAWSKISWQLLSQNGQVGEAFVRMELENAIQRAIDTAAINGSGSSNQPTGILNTSGIGSVAGGTNGAVPTFANLVALESAVDVADGLIGNLNYLTTAGIIGKLKTVEKTSTSTAQFIATMIANGMAEINGYTAMRSSLVPKTLTKGSASNCHAIIFGNWAELIIAQWAGMFLTVDDITLAGNAQTKITVNSFNDIGVRHAASFAAMKDALIA